MSTERPRFAVRLAIAALVAIGLSSLARGQTYDVLHAFTVPATLPVAGLVQGTDGFFYGTTLQGGTATYGTVYRDPRS